MDKIVSQEQKRLGLTVNKDDQSDQTTEALIDDTENGSEIEIVKIPKEKISISPSEKKTTLYCKECGTKLIPPARFCSMCGTKLQ